MARTGVTETQVHAAADELILAGEKPTIERLRAHLGTGSPNTLLRALETWWSSLGQRLLTLQSKLALPGAPEEVVVAANRFWHGALAHASAWAQGQLAAEREVIQTKWHELDQAQSALSKDRSELERALVESRAKQDELAERLAEAREHLSERLAEIQELKQERSVLTEAQRTADARAANLQQRLDAQDTAASARLEELRAHSLKSEEHWLAEVDRLRQELKVVQKELTVDRHLSQEAARRAQNELLEAARARSETERQLAAARAEAAAFDRQLQRLGTVKPASGSKAATSKPSKPTSRARKDPVASRRRAT